MSERTLAFAAMLEAFLYGTKEEFEKAEAVYFGGSDGND